jgi:hypothetical protein
MHPAFEFVERCERRLSFNFKVGRLQDVCIRQQHSALPERPSDQRRVARRSSAEDNRATSQSGRRYLCMMSIRFGASALLAKRVGQSSPTCRQREESPISAVSNDRIRWLRPWRPPRASLSSASENENLPHPLSPHLGTEYRSPPGKMMQSLRLVPSACASKLRHDLSAVLIADHLLLVLGARR